MARLSTEKIEQLGPPESTTVGTLTPPNAIPAPKPQKPTLRVGTEGEKYTVGGGLMGRRGRGGLAQMRRDLTKMPPPGLGGGVGGGGTGGGGGISPVGPPEQIPAPPPTPKPPPVSKPPQNARRRRRNRRPPVETATKKRKKKGQGDQEVASTLGGMVGQGPQGEVLQAQAELLRRWRAGGGRESRSPYMR